jgi:23S rRNA (guanosine2251-2'-O)-methyltransferase
LEEFIFGTRAVMEAIAAGKDIERVLLRKRAESEGAQELFSLLRLKNIEFQFVPVEKLNRVTRKNHQGVIAYLSLVGYTQLEEIVSRAYESGKDPFVLILDHISDVRNFGAIARTAECAGLDGIVIPEKGSVRITADAVKTSAGALMKIPVARVNSLREAINYLSMSGLAIVSATEKSDTDLYAAGLTGPIAVIMGSEDMGVSSSLLELSDKRIRIPMLGEIGSLNVSVAAGVVIYEIIRQRVSGM